jgi:hypothetical protein
MFPEFNSSSWFSYPYIEIKIMELSLPNVLYGCLFVYVARMVLVKSEAKKTKDAKGGFRTEMKDASVGLKTADIIPDGPYVSAN